MIRKFVSLYCDSFPSPVYALGLVIVHVLCRKKETNKSREIFFQRRKKILLIALPSLTGSDQGQNSAEEDADFLL